MLKDRIGIVARLNTDFEAFGRLRQCVDDEVNWHSGKRPSHRHQHGLADSDKVFAGDRSIGRHRDMNFHGGVGTRVESDHCVDRAFRFEC